MISKMFKTKELIDYMTLKQIQVDLKNLDFAKDKITTSKKVDIDSVNSNLIHINTIDDIVTRCTVLFIYIVSENLFSDLSKYIAYIVCQNLLQLYDYTFTPYIESKVIDILISEYTKDGSIAIVNFIKKFCIKNYKDYNFTKCNQCNSNCDLYDYCNIII